MKHPLPQMGDETHTDDALRRRKQQLREQARTARDSMPPEHTRPAAEQAARHLLALPELANASAVAIYAVRGNELDPAPAAMLLRARGTAVAYPRVTAHRQQLTFHLVAPEALVPGVFGLSEPPADAPELPLDRIDAFVIPGLAFDRNGNRLGWGRGHYDRTLAQAPHALRIGYAYARQLVPAVPVGPRDAPVDIVLCETGPAHVGSWTPTRTGPGPRTGRQ